MTTDPLHGDRDRIAFAVIAALMVWLMFNGVSKGLAAVGTGEIEVGGGRG